MANNGATKAGEEAVFPSLIKKTLLAYFTKFPRYAETSMPDAQITADAFWDTMPPWIRRLRSPRRAAAHHHWSYHGTHHCGATPAAGEIYLYPGDPAYEWLPALLPSTTTPAARNGPA